MAQTKKTTSIRPKAIRETSISLHHGDPIDGPPETPQVSHHYDIKGYKGDSELAQIITSLSDSRCSFSQPGGQRIAELVFPEILKRSK